MTTKYWIGGATAVAQVSTIQITAYDAATTYEVTIGGVTVSVPGNTNVNTTASDLKTALENSTHPYFTAITWSVATDTVTGTAAVSGVPFTATSSKSGGTGTIGAVSTTTASAGPDDWSTADNWSDGAVPVATDTVIFANNSINCVYGLNQNTIDLSLLEIEHTYSGKIGLPSHKFSTSVDGDTFNTTVPEYRDQYLTIGADAINIGQFNSVTQPSGSGRIKIDNDKSGASINTVYRTAQTPTDTGFAAIQFKANHADADFFIREAKGGVSFALGGPAETATVGDIYVSASGTESKVFIGSGVTLSEYTQTGGSNSLNAAATISALTVKGGTLTVEGDFTVTTMNIDGGTVFDNHKKSGGNAVTTCNVTSGTLNLTRSSEARTIATLNPDGGSIITDDSYITITTLDKPAGAATISVST